MESEYEKVRNDLDKLAKSEVGEQTVEPTTTEDDEEAQVVPEEWNMLSNADQEKAEEQYKEKTFQDYLDSEIENWQSDTAPGEAKENVAYDFNKNKKSEHNQWVFDVLNELRDARRENETRDFPFTNEQLFNAISMNDDFAGMWPEPKPDFEFDDEKLIEPKDIDLSPSLPGIEPPKPSEFLTKEMRDEIIGGLEGAFEGHVENVLSWMNPPDYLNESVTDFQEEMWAQMDDKSKFDWVVNNTDIVEQYEQGSSTVPEESITLDKMPDKLDPIGLQHNDVNYKRTQILGRLMSKHRAIQLLLARKVSAPGSEGPRPMKAGSEVEYAAGLLDRGLWEGWKGSSTSPQGRILQVAIADELGGRLNTAKIGPDATRREADELYKHAGGYEGVKAYVRAKWEVTQYLLEKAQLPVLPLYRGLTLDGAEKAKTKIVKEVISTNDQVLEFKHIPDVKVNRNGAASFTTDLKIANEWKSGHDNAVVIRALVPRTAVISVPAYGQNVYGEHEVVVSGTAWKGWDAWARTAPTLPIPWIDHTGKEKPEKFGVPLQ